MLKTSFIITLLLLLSACAENNIKDESSLFYAVPVGSILTLHQTLTISGDQVAVYVQQGELKPERDVNKYYPNCKFEIYTMSEQSRLVQSDSFEIVKVEDQIESSAIKRGEGVRVAALGSFAGMALDRSQMFNYATLLYLNSEQQKDVYRLTCQHWEDIVDDKHLTIDEMRGAMGAIFTLELKETQ